MLTDGSYYTAMAAYLLAGVTALALLGWWLRARRVLALWLVLTGAALLLLPAFPEPGMDTMAPALVVAVFQLGTAGVDAAMHALRPLAAACVLAQVLFLPLAWLLRRRASAP
jgi:hypothetical protein